jgi:isochorismate hydrolase
MDSEGLGNIQLPKEQKQLLSRLMEKHPLRMDASAALLVIDVQRHFFDPASPVYFSQTKEIQGAIEKMVGVFVERKRPVFFSKHMDTSDTLMDGWWKNSLVKENPFAGFAIDSSEGEVFEKHTYDAFYQTDLEQSLRNLGVGIVVLVGVSTHLCIETTTRSAFVRGFQPVIPIDAVAAKNSIFHEGALINLAHGFSMLTTTKELVHCLER